MQNIFEQLSLDNNFDEFSISTPARDEEDSSNIFESIAKQESKNKEDSFGFLDTAKDVAQQIVKGGISGIGGAYGNLLDATGLQLKKGEELPGKKAIAPLQEDILDRLSKGEPTSAGEIAMLSDDDVIPSFSRLPTSKEIKSTLGEGKTPLGRVASRGAEVVGEALATGGGPRVLAFSGGSGLAGQSIREGGGSEGLASAVEIVGPIASSGISKKLVPSSGASKKIVEAGRKVGLSENQITPLIQGEKKIATLSKVARKGDKTKKLFSSIKEDLGNSYDTIKKSPAGQSKISDAGGVKLSQRFSDIKNDLQKTLKPSPDKQAAIDFISDASKKAKIKGATGEDLVNFWQDINKSVNWNSIDGGKKQLARLKQPILEALEGISPELAKDFDMTNQLYSKYAQVAKKLKPDMVDAIINKSEILAIPVSALSLVQGNPFALKALAAESAIRTLSTEMLINPYFQNISSKLVKNFNQGSVKSISEIMKQVREYMSRKHKDEDWSFLTED